MGLRVKRYGPLATIVLLGKLVGTFEPPRVIVVTAQANSTRASANTMPPSQAADTVAGTKRNGKSQPRAMPTAALMAQASGGRTRTWAVSTVPLVSTLSAGAPNERLERAATRGRDA